MCCPNLAATLPAGLRPHRKTKSRFLSAPHPDDRCGNAAQDSFPLGNYEEGDKPLTPWATFPVRWSSILLITTGSSMPASATRQVRGLLIQVGFDPDASLVFVFSWAVVASAALRTLDFLCDATDQQPLSDPSGVGGVGMLGIDVAGGRFTQ